METTANRRDDGAGRRTGDTRGAVYVEFLIAFIPVFVMLLGMIQSALLYTGHLVVQHSAVVAARAAIVVLPDDPLLYDGAAKNTLADGSDQGGGGSPVGALLVFLGSGAGGVPTIPGLAGGRRGGGGSGSGSDPSAVYAGANARMRLIHEAASIPLLAISPSIQQLVPTMFGRMSSIREGIGSDDPALRAVAGGQAYNLAAMAVTFPQRTGGHEEYVNRYDEDNAPVTVRVTYLFHCAIPIARQFMCDDPISLFHGDFSEARRIVASDLGRSPSPEQIASAFAQLRAIDARQRSARTGISELASAPWSVLALATALTGQRFAIVHSDATLPLQGARYPYLHGTPAPAPGMYETGEGGEL